MSMFYCIAHDRLEDSDFVGYEVTNAGEEFCDEGYAEMLETRINDTLNEWAEHGEPDDDVHLAQYDNDPSPYDGTYSEE